MEEKAKLFAAEKHKGQTRKYTGEPYVEHCYRVTDYVKKFTLREEVVAASILHDTLEDTDTTYVELVREFSPGVAFLVKQLTDKYTKVSYSNLNRKERKFLEACRLETISMDAKLIKYFDIMDNSSTIFKHDPKFAQTYLKEKQFILSYALANIDFSIYLGNKG